MPPPRGVGYNVIQRIGVPVVAPHTGDAEILQIERRSAETAEYFTPVSDATATHEHMRKTFGLRDASVIAVCLRRMASAYFVFKKNGDDFEKKSIFWLVENGYTVAFPEPHELGGLRPEFLNPTLPRAPQVTSRCLVFFLPKLVEDSRGKTLDEQLGLLAQLRDKYIPKGLLGNEIVATFGNLLPLAVLSGVMEAACREYDRLPCFREFARTATLDHSGVRFSAGYSGASREDPWTSAHRRAQTAPPEETEELAISREFDDNKGYRNLGIFPSWMIPLE